MIVSDLIAKLQSLPPNLQVMFDATPKDAEMFKFVSVDECDEIVTNENEDYVLLSCGFESLTASPN